MESKLRIIAGEWRSRQLVFEDFPGLRPTPSRVRETLFNWLSFDVLGCQCLDLFAGSGALGFEAASRGAASVVMIEENASICRLIKQNINKLSATQIKLIRSDAFRFLATDAVPYNLVFVDPPFARGLAQQSCHWLEDKGWLAPLAKIYLEVESALKLDGLPENWVCLKHKKAGQVAYYLYERR